MCFSFSSPWAASSLFCSIASNPSGWGDGKFVIAIWEKYCDLPVAWRFGIVLVGMSAVGLVLWLTEPAT